MSVIQTSVTTHSRSSGHSATAAAAYRSGSEVTDERTGEIHDYSRKEGVEHSEIVLPAGSPEWAMDREKLWNAVEAAEDRKNSTVSREFLISFPAELSGEGSLELRQRMAREYTRALVERHGFAAEFSMHEPTGKGDQRNYHCHVLTSTRRMEKNGFFHPSETFKSRPRKGEPKASGKCRELDDMKNPVALVEAKALWSQIASRELEKAGFQDEARRWEHSHLTKREQGERALERGDISYYRECQGKPQISLGPAATALERAGIATRQGDINRERSAEAARAELDRINIGMQLEQNPALLIDRVVDRKSVFDHRDLARELHLHIDDAATFQRIMAEAQADPRLMQLSEETMVDGRRNVAKYSTIDMIAMEKRLVATAEVLSERQFHHVDPAKVEQVLEQRRTMTDEQKDMVRVVTAPNQFAVVVGDAGTGKSFSMGAAREIWEHSGYNVRGLALAGKAAEELQHGSGIESGTLASFELRLDKGFIKLTDRDILVIDESGMVGAKQLDRVLREAESAGAKVVWAGDSKQLEAIHAGAAHRTVTERLGASEITEVQRQKEQWQKDASFELARGDFKAGLDAYKDRGFVHMAETQDGARAVMVQQYMNDRGSLNSGGQIASQAVITHRNADVKAINEEIRNAIKERGELADGIKVQTAKGEREFADGDRLLFLKNDRELGVKNGSLGTVERAADGAISVKLDSGKSVQFDPAKYRNFDHGYAFTVHKTQGASVDKAYAFMSPSNNHALSYVAMTRHKDELHVHGSLEKFQSYEQMAERLGKRQVKESTLDYAESAAKLQAKREQERAAEKGAAPAQESKQSAALSALGNRAAESSKLKRAWANLEAEKGQGSKLEQAKAKWRAEIEDEKGQGTQSKRKQAWANQEKSQQEPKQRERDQGHEM